MRRRKRWAAEDSKNDGWWRASTKKRFRGGFRRPHLLPSSSSYIWSKLQQQENDVRRSATVFPIHLRRCVYYPAPLHLCQRRLLSPSSSSSSPSAPTTPSTHHHVSGFGGRFPHNLGGPPTSTSNRHHASCQKWRRYLFGF